MPGVETKEEAEMTLVEGTMRAEEMMHLEETMEE